MQRCSLASACSSLVSLKEWFVTDRQADRMTHDDSISLHRASIPSHGRNAAVQFKYDNATDLQKIRL